MTPAEFIAKWRDTGFGESQGAQSFFNDLCALAGHPTPAEYGNPEAFTFEKPVPGGRADAYLEDHFGWEFKGRDSQLEGAFTQLLRYQVYLKTPPLLIVSSFETILIRTNFPGMETVLHQIPVLELDQPDNLNKLRYAFHAPAELRPIRSVEDVTRETARLFGEIVADMEQRDEDPEKLARYLNQIVFCLYAEDVGLLPEGVFSNIAGRFNREPAMFNRAVGDLFERMAEGGLFGVEVIRHFDGDLFNTAEPIELSTAALERLAEATGKNWRNIEPSILGTLFERALDASKRSQLGAHYTSAEDIMLVVEPVVLAPLRREWEAARQEIEACLDDEDHATHAAARERLEAFQRRLAGVTVLDPACGSGNFLYLALRSLLDLEKAAIDFGAAQGWHDLAPTVRPDRMLGLEINHYATELARTALWIGYIQWHQANGFDYNHSPVLTPLDTIRQTDAILDLTDAEKPKEPEWPAAEFIIGNPPFLGGALMRDNLGDPYVKPLFKLYGKRIPNFSDLCCYWFEKARHQIESGSTVRVGLLATQGIRGKDNRTVLQRIKKTGEIFMAYPDSPWILDGATVHISIVGFDGGSETEREFDGVRHDGKINADLTIGVDLTAAKRLKENGGISFEGPSPKGRFDISAEVATQMLDAPLNVNGKPNSDVVRPVMNAKAITQRYQGTYTIDFGVDMSEYAAAQYEAPFEYVVANVKPGRITNRIRWRAEHWWLYGAPAPAMRRAMAGLERYIATPRVSKHRIFVWVESDVLCNDSTDVFARADDYFFGVLHSRFHELWARGMGTQLREAESGFRYTPTTCFETFPFPEPTEEQREAIAAAARELDQLRGNWLHPPGLVASELRRRTLTNLYNQRPKWLDNAHGKLDAAVAAAYGWPADLGEQEVLGRLLSLNLGIGN